MSEIRPSDRELLEELIEQAGTHTPDYTDEVLAATRHVRQRPAVTFPSRWLPDGRLAMLSRVALVAAVVAVVPVALLLAGGAGPEPSPVPQGTAPATPAASSSPVPSETPGPTSSPLPAARYEACAAGPGAALTLTVWDRASDPDEISALATLDAELEAANPGLDIVRVQMDSTMSADALRDALGASTGPDIVQLDGGRERLLAAAAAGLLLPLDDVAGQYGWQERWNAELLDRGRADASDTPGQGTLYGVSSTASVLGLFQNYELAVNRPSRPAPKTLDEELDDLAAMAEAGYLPLLVGGADGGLADLYALLASAASEPGWSTELALARDAASFDTPATRHAAELLREIARRGYLGDAYATGSQAAAEAGFAVGAAELLVATSDRNRTLSEQSNALGVPMFVVFPAATEGEPTRLLVRLGDPWVVRRSTSAPGCASAVVDFLTGDHAGDVLATRGIVPSHPVYTSPNLGSASFMDIIGLLRTASRADTTAYPLDDAFPGARALIDEQARRLLANETTPEDFVAALEAAYREYVVSRR